MVAHANFLHFKDHRRIIHSGLNQIEDKIHKIGDTSSYGQKRIYLKEIQKILSLEIDSLRKDRMRPKKKELAIKHLQTMSHSISDYEISLTIIKKLDSDLKSIDLDFNQLSSNHKKLKQSLKTLRDSLKDNDQYSDNAHAFFLQLSNNLNNYSSISEQFSSIRSEYYEVLEKTKDEKSYQKDIWTQIQTIRNELKLERLRIYNKKSLEKSKKHA